MNIAYLSIGSNIGDRLTHLMNAVHALHTFNRTSVLKISSVYETEPVGYTDQANFLNIAIQIETALNPLELLAVCQGIEIELGRVRDIRWGPRIVDLDILLFNQDIIDIETLTVPHPRMHERAFVLIPLLEIEPFITHPVTKTCYSEGEALEDDGVVLLEKVNEVSEFMKTNHDVERV